MYDAWGNATVTYSNDGDILPSKFNPFRYRDYYYDSDLNLYYVNSRYYDAKLCRWISPDAVEIIASTPMSLSDNNLYAYCDNNPVNRVDYGGEFWNYVIGGVVGAVIGGAVAWINGGDTADILIGAAGGALSGVVAASGLGWLAQAGISAAISATADAGNQLIDILQSEGTIADYDIFQTIYDAGLGFATSAIGSGLGALTGKYITKTDVISKKAFDTYLGKTFSVSAAVLFALIIYDFKKIVSKRKVVPCAHPQFFLKKNQIVVNGMYVSFKALGFKKIDLEDV